MRKPRVRSRVVPLAFLALALAGSAAAIATSCDSSSGHGAGDASAEGSSIDGASSRPDAGRDAASSLPNGFPAHFSGVPAPSGVVDLTDLCAIDTGTATRGASISICAGGGAPVVSSPPNLVVVQAQNATILFAQSLHVTHKIAVTGDRTLAIVSAGEALIEASIDVSAHGSIAGPGAADASSIGNGNQGLASAGTGTGGGGGGFGDIGGGNGSGGGAVYGADAATFIGGSAGGASQCGTPAKGGGGGGAIQISASSLIIINGGSIRAAGGGGEHCESGGGGGSGGTIFLESVGAFIISGAITANGGGGGSGRSSANSTGGANGSDGLPTTMPAPGGVDDLDGGVNGGTGGAVQASAEAGAHPPAASPRGGGGGGGVGRIWLRSLRPPSGSPAFSPVPVILSF